MPEPHILSEAPHSDVDPLLSPALPPGSSPDIATLNPETASSVISAKQRHLRQMRSLVAGILCDALLIMTGMQIAYWMRYSARWPAPFARIVREVVAQNFVPREQFLPFGLLLLGLLLGLYASRGLYRLPRNAGFFDHASIIVSSTTVGIAIVIVVVFLYSSSAFYSRLIFGFAWLTIIALLCLWRLLLIEWRRLRWLRGVGREQVIVVGGTGLGRSVMGSIVARPFLGYQLAGYLDDREPPPEERPDGHFRHIGTVNDLPLLLNQLPIDQVILALPFWENERLPELVNICRDAAVEFRIAPDLHQLSFERIDVTDLGGVPILGFKEVSLRGVNLLIKRAMDVGLILLMTPVLVPLISAIVLLIKRDSPGPALFTQQRVGRNGQPFMVYKFRTMVNNAEERKAELAALNEADGPIFKMKDDPRVTEVGKVLRRTSLDELPNLWNVLRGEMSLVGPRPPTPDEVSQYNEWQKRRLEVTPGMTGLWQVLGRSDTSFDEMVRLDIYYAENWTPTLDMRILLQTIPAVLSGKGAY